jgi:tripartite-type tricarboxylate transporter receptor subunit TctC
MNPSRRHVLRLAATVAALPAVRHAGYAQSYPARPVRIVVGFAAGGGFDITARFIGQWLSERLGKPFVVENRPGAGSNIATEAVVRARGDGYTLLLAGSPNAINATLYDNLNYDFIRDIAPVAGLVRFSNVLVVNPAFPAKTVAEFVAYAMANPGRLNFGAATGTSIHLSGELFKLMAGVDMVHVPYRGVVPALTDLLGEQLQAVFANTAAVAEYIKAGRLRALAVTSAMRVEDLPDVPALAEVLPGFESSVFYGLGAPRNTPAALIDQLNSEINAGLSDAAMKGRLAKLGGTVLPGSPADFGKLIADETEKWGKVIRAANIKPD